MPSPEDIHEQQERLTDHRHTLAHHLKQQAIIGEAHAPPGTSHGIREARTEIARIKAVLRGWGVAVEDHPDDIAQILQEMQELQNKLNALPFPSGTPQKPPSDRPGGIQSNTITAGGDVVSGTIIKTHSGDIVHGNQYKRIGMTSNDEDSEQSLSRAFEALSQAAAKREAGEKLQKVNRRIQRLRDAVADDELDLQEIEVVQTWFQQNLPEVISYVNCIICHPFVRRSFSNAGKGDEYAQRFPCQSLIPGGS